VSSRRAPYAVAIAAVAVTFGFTLLVRPLAEQSSFPLLFAAVMVSAWYGGLRPGLLASALATLASAAVLVPPTGAFRLGGAGLVQLTVFVAVSLLIASLTTAREEAARERAQLRLRDQAAAQWVASEARFRTLLESAPDAIVISRRDGHIMFVNAQAERLFGYGRDELIGQPAELLVPERLREKHIRHREDYAVEPRARAMGAGLELAGRRKDGTEVPVEISLSPLHTEEGLLVTSMIRDVTDRRHAETALRESEARFRSVFEHTRIGMALQAPDGRYVRVNHAFCDLLGFAEAELLAAAPEALSHPDERDADAAAVRELLAGVRSVDQREKRYLHKLGHVVWALVSVSVIRDPEGRPRYLSAQAQDITAWKGLQAQLRQAQKMEAVGQLAGGVAHDFNNLLTVICGRSGLLQHHLAPDDPLRRHVDLIETAAAQGARLTGQLLAFSRKQTLQPSTLNLNDILAQMHDMLRRLIGEEIELVVAPGPELGHVRADPSQIEQVILNLAVNARDAMPNGGRLRLETANVKLDEAFVRHHPGSRPGAYVQLAVTDTGVGMDAEIRSHLFEPFFTTKGLGKGTGLGLATVYGIVKQSGGYIAVQSQPGRGSTFTVYLPRSEAPLEAPPAWTTAPAGGAETVLLVEDEASVRDLVCEMLVATGYTVLGARHGGEALVVADQHAGPIHLLLSDIVMPHMGGRELARRLRRARPTLKVLYMSGYLGDATPPEGLEQGMQLLAKPFTAEALARKLREVLDAPWGDASRAPGS